jgi:hypothetical protein
MQMAQLRLFHLTMLVTVMVMLIARSRHVVLEVLKSVKMDLEASIVHLN